MSLRAYGPLLEVSSTGNTHTNKKKKKQKQKRSLNGLSATSRMEEAKTTKLIYITQGV